MNDQYTIDGLGMRCKIHPRYACKRAPRIACEGCWRVWLRTELMQARMESLQLKLNRLEYEAGH